MTMLKKVLAGLRAGLLSVGRWASPYTALLVLAVAVGVIALRAIDAALAAMHEPGEVAASATKTAGIGALLDPAHAQAAVRSWHDWADLPASADFLSPTQLVAGYVVVDVLLVAAPLTLLVLRLLSRARDDALAHGEAYALKAATATAAANAAIPALGYFLADVAEDALLLSAVVNGAERWEVTLLGVASLLKWTALILAVAPWLLARLALRTAKGMNTVPEQARGGILAPVIILRAQVVTVGVLAILLLALQGDLGRQVQDVLLGLPERFDHELIALAAALAFALLTYSTGLACLVSYDKPPDGPPLGKEELRPLTLWVTALIGLATAIAGWYLAVQRDQSLGWFVVPPGVLLIAFSVLSALRDVRRAWADTPGVGPSTATGRWLRTLVSVPLAAFALVAMHGAVTLAVVREFGNAANLLVFAALLATAAIALLVWQAPWKRAESVRASNVRNLLLAVGAVAVATVVVWGAKDPWTVGERVGSIGILLAFLAAVLVITTGLVVVGDRWAARGALALARFRRVPLITLVVVCYAATSYLDTAGRYHDARLITTAAPANQALTVADAFRAWLAENQAGTGTDDKPHVPMVFIATAGGGIRAAYWTTTVLDCLFGPTRDCGSPVPAGSAPLPPGSTDAIFAASGISGGSVGLVAFRAVDDGAGPARLILEDHDFVAPILTAFAFRDAPNALLHADLDWLDRAGVLEVAWERAAAERGRSLRTGFVASSFNSAGDPRFPLLVLSGVAVEDGCRVTVSALDAAPAGEVSCVSLAPFTGQPAIGPTLARTRDALDYACDTGGTVRDLRLSTAALLSARFPYVSPSGGLTSCTNPARRTFVLDGGLIDASGASPLVELWSALSPLVQAVNMDPQSGVCLDPRLILIDNGYADARLEGLPRRPQELLAPLQAQSKAGGSGTAAARQAAAIAFQATLARPASCRQPGGAIDPPQVTGSVAHFYPRLHPGPLAPLGWTLSTWAEDELRGQLAENESQIIRVHRWFE